MFGIRKKLSYKESLPENLLAIGCDSNRGAPKIFALSLGKIETNQCLEVKKILSSDLNKKIEEVKLLYSSSGRSL